MRSGTSSPRPPSTAFTRPTRRSVGRAAIVAAWVGPEGEASGRDEPGTYAASYRPFALDGARAVAVGWSRYWTDAARRVERAVYDNCFLLEFDPAGRCRSFMEFYRERG